MRFAPSPTGHLHIGAARTAIYNWLFARHYQGKFILRIEDTDVERSSEEMSQGIIDGLRWLGLDWDEGPMFQSQRLNLYQERAEELVRLEQAYPCFCLPAEIQERKSAKEAAGEYWEYDRRCLKLTPTERDRCENEGRARAIRFNVPEADIHYRDLLHGPITVNSESIEDFVLLRSDGLPTYHLSVVVDDIELEITHVIRGDDHISNTPKQILLYRAFGAPLPAFAHQSLILGPDRKKLSKRHGVTSVLKFRDEGILALALLNYLAQMSWSPGEERIYSVEEMVEKFNLEKRSGGNPVFDMAKLEWLNGQLISQMAADELMPLVKAALEQAGLWQDSFETVKKDWFLKLLGLLQERSRKVSDFPGGARPFLSDDFPYDKEAVEKHLQNERLEGLIPKLKEDFSGMDSFSAVEIEQVLRLRAENEEVKAALLIHAARVLVLGMGVSPGIFDVLELVGRVKTIERLTRFENIKRDFFPSGERQ